MMGVLKIASLPGDGIGQEVVPAALRVMRAAGARFGVSLEVEALPFGADHYLATGVTMPEAEYARLGRDFDAIFLGGLGDPRVPDNKHAIDILLGLRFKLDLYINYRPTKLWREDLCPLKGKTAKDVDFVVFRENTEDMYTGAGGQIKRGTPDEIAIQEMVYTRKGVERVIRAAFEHAHAHGDKRVCMADKANALRYVGDLWRRTFKEVAADYPHIQTRVEYVDVLCMHLVRNPEWFDVIVTSNLFGDIVTDLAAGLAGGLGLAVSANLHPGRAGLFEPVHGTAPDLAGKDLANPLAAILTGALLLETHGHRGPAAAIEAAVAAVLARHAVTRDLGGALGTQAATQAVLDAL